MENNETQTLKNNNAALLLLLKTEIHIFAYTIINKKIDGVEFLRLRQKMKQEKNKK